MTDWKRFRAAVEAAISGLAEEFPDFRYTLIIRDPEDVRGSSIVMGDDPGEALDCFAASLAHWCDREARMIMTGELKPEDAVYLKAMAGRIVRDPGEAAPEGTPLN